MSPVANSKAAASRGIEIPTTESAPVGRGAFAGAFALLNPHFSELDRYLQAQLAAFEPEIRDMADYCIYRAGKRIRPALVFFSGWGCADSAGPQLVRAAAIVELVHLATLVHDDIMDGAGVRRGMKTAAREYGSAVAVLLGDALFAHALNLAAEFPTTEVCAAVSESSRRVCAGEILQTLRSRSVDVTERDYRRIIELKTGELFRASCFLGARLAGCPPSFVEAACGFGRHLGVAYQIYDDLLDFYGAEKAAGKTLGTDLSGGKLTLPLLVLLDRLPPLERDALKEEIAGRRPAQPELRLRQMDELGVFAAVEAAVVAELSKGEDALSPWTGSEPAALLRGLSGAFRGQIAALRS